MPALRILLVEDETIVAMLFADLLVAMGHEVCAIEATEAATAKPAAAFRAVSALDESLPAGTLFAATILSATLPVHQAALTELHIRRNRDWTPPESILHLRDKTI